MKKQVLLTGLFLIGATLLISMTSLKTSIQEPWKVPAKYEKMANPYDGDADAGKIGKMLYAKHCKSCHGSKGLGDGSKADSIDTEVTDITTDEFKAQSDGALYFKSYVGRDDMPSFEKKISKSEDQWLLINYIKKF